MTTAPLVLTAGCAVGHGLRGGRSITVDANLSLTGETWAFTDSPTQLEDRSAFCLRGQRG